MGFLIGESNKNNEENTHPEHPWAAAALAVTALTLAIPSAHAASSGAVTITPRMPTDHVRVVIHNSGGKVFARLKVSQ